MLPSTAPTPPPSSPVSSCSTHLLTHTSHPSPHTALPADLLCNAVRCFCVRCFASCIACWAMLLWFTLLHVAAVVLRCSDLRCCACACCALLRFALLGLLCFALHYLLRFTLLCFVLCCCALLCLRRPSRPHSTPSLAVSDCAWCASNYNSETWYGVNLTNMARQLESGTCAETTVSVGGINVGQDATNCSIVGIFAGSSAGTHAMWSRRDSWSYAALHHIRARLAALCDPSVRYVIRSLCVTRPAPNTTQHATLT
jgi:hypothetical protein